MTAKDAILETDALRPNAFTDEEKLRWLWRMDAAYAMDVTHIFPLQFSKTAYGKDDVLLIEDAFGDVYIKFLLSQIDFANGEIGRYNASAMLFNAAYDRVLNHMARNHKKAPCEVNV